MPPHRAQRSKNQGRVVKQAIQQVPEYKDDAQSQALVQSVQSFQFCITAINVLTIFCDIIFLQILMLRNAVPMTDGILMNSRSSVSYFVIALINLIFLYANHEAISYMVLDIWYCVSMFYGICVLSHGITIIAVDSGVNKLANANNIWANLSQFQQDYFDNDVNNFSAQRS